MRWTASCVTDPFSDATMWQAGKGDDQPEWMADMFPKPLARGICCHRRAMLEEQAGPRPLRRPERVTGDRTLWSKQWGLSDPAVGLLIPLLGNPRNFRQNPPLCPDSLP